MIHSYAVVLQLLINSDGKVTQIERNKFNEFFKQKFDVTDEEISKLMDATKNEDYKEHLNKLKSSLEPMEKLSFMQYINQVIISDGIENIEYEVFEEVKNSLI